MSPSPPDDAWRRPEDQPGPYEPPYPGGSPVGPYDGHPAPPPPREQYPGQYSYSPPPPPPPQHYAGAYPAQPPRRRRRRWPWFLLAALAAVVIAASLSAGSTKTPATGSPDPGATAADAPDARVGQTVTEGQFAMTVTAITYPTGDVGDSHAKGRWAVAHIKVKNTGDTPQTFYTDSQAGYVGALRYSPDPAATFALAAGSGDASMANEMGPGNIATIALPFDIAKGKKLTALVLHENPTSEGVRVRA